MRTKTWLAMMGWLAGGALATAVYAAVTLTIGDVIKMSKAGVSDDVIIQTVQSSGSVFQLRPQDVEALKHSGVSDRVVAAMQARPQAAAPPPRPVEGAGPVVHEPSGRDYVGGGNEPVVRALPADPPVYTYQAPPPATYYYYPAYPYPYYYAPGPYYYGPGVGFYFGYGGWHRHWR